ncbi:EAL domain-containing protein [Cryobacterium sp. PH31-O1]|uniref:putative bifunctional diguanylate cyclase/phosphodiesterase n=1 Tax=Cryobacterium sp. PH31-O1 TaxID=3046306 RepID=UPI0024B91213|nr:EAL domain-containing protein [Cryobacterium sp. PH31-O1]MDJ0338240.1 EAL domain-containing protein [Cryobacterium sp. PH31-O1]
MVKSKNIAVGTAAPTLLRRPVGVLQGTRWLFLWLALLTLLFSVPGSLSLVGVNAVPLLLAAVATLVLWGSWIYSFLRQRVPFALEVLDAIALTAFAMAGPSTAAMTPLLLASAWLRTLYGTPWRSVVRSVLYATALVGVTVLWPLVPEHTTAPDLLRQAGVISIVVLTIVAAGQLRTSLQAYDWAIERDQELTRAGSMLLGLTDPHRIRALAWNVANQLTSTTPGLRVLKIVRDGDLLRIGARTGDFADLPEAFPFSVLQLTGTDRTDARITDFAPLNAAVGLPLVWECISLTEQSEQAWLLVGAPNRIPAGTILSTRSLVNQVNLALRNSDAHHQLEAQATHDPLTGLDNRLSFTTKLAALLDQSATPASLHVLFLDLDDFKDVNDQLGHREGDTVLIEVAARLRRCIRPLDVCARLGGDEFAVVLRSTTDDGATAIAQRMVRAVSEPVIVTGRSVQVGASVGVAAATTGLDLDELVHHADVAMYAAKANGKGQVQVFQPGLLQSQSMLMSFERRLNRAAAAGELEVHYQPIMSLTDLVCTGAEALVRWNHPERGLLLPDEFVPLAETTGSIIGVGAFVLQTACAEAATWPESSPGVPMTVQVNVSARELESVNYVDSVLRYVAESGLPANRLVLELTETVALQSVAALERLKTLATHGIQLALDDFGTGYASLSALRLLPITVVKLDACFVSGMHTNVVDRSVVEAVVQMSTKLGITTIAEGVEYLEEQSLLVQIGADSAQGHLYSRAVPAAELHPWLTQTTRARLG